MADSPFPAMTSQDDVSMDVPQVVTQEIFDKIRVEASVICAEARYNIAEEQAEIARQDLRLNLAASRLIKGQ